MYTSKVYEWSKYFIKSDNDFTLNCVHVNNILDPCTVYSVLKGSIRVKYYVDKMYMYAYGEFQVLFYTDLVGAK